MKNSSVSLALALCTVIPAATPAAADSNACTHHFSGPQICIRLEGRNSENSVTGFWANPPKSAKSRTVWLTVDGKQYGKKERATRVGETLSYHWTSWDQGTDAKICVHFKDIDRVACERTKFTGNRINF